MSKEKNGSPASTASGTASISVNNNNTSSGVYQGNNYFVAAHEAVETVVARASVTGNTNLASLADEVVAVTRSIVAGVNKPADHGGREMGWTKPKGISPIQAAELVFEMEIIRMVCTKETIRKPKAEGVLAMYVHEGEAEGTYQEIGIGQIDSWCSEMAGSVDDVWQKKFAQKLHDLASRKENRISECDDANLIFMSNGIYTYDTGLMMDFDPEIVVLRKNATYLPEVEPPEPVHTMPDGSKLSFWQWVDSLAPYDGGRDLLVKVAGAALRNRHNWRVMVTVFNKTGSNGKSTFLGHLKSLVGYDGVMTSDLASLADSVDGKFAIANLIGTALITCEDSDSGAYIKRNSRLKSIISHDTVAVERKYGGIIDYTPHALIVCAANDIAKTKDKGQAWLDRNIYVPFTGHFEGAGDDKTIRDKWVVSEEFCSYMAYQALKKWEKYYVLPEPKEALELKEEWIADNDPVVEFWRDYLSLVHSDFIPNEYAWESYKLWLPEARPSTTLPSQRTFTPHFLEVATASGEWMQPLVKDGSGKKINGEKWCPDLVLHDPKRARMSFAGRYRGIVKTKMWEYCMEHDITPKDIPKKA